MNAFGHVVLIGGVATLAACGPKDFTIEGPLRRGKASCGGELALHADRENRQRGELSTTDDVTTVTPLDPDNGDGAVIAMQGGQRFILYFDTDHVADPIAVGDRLNVSIECGPVGWQAFECFGEVIRDHRVVVTFNTLPDKIADWSVSRGPLLRRRVHSN